MSKKKTSSVVQGVCKVPGLQFFSLLNILNTIFFYVVIPTEIILIYYITPNWLFLLFITSTICFYCVNDKYCKLPTISKIRVSWFKDDRLVFGLNLF